MESDNYEMWFNVMKEELKSMDQVWNLVKLFEGFK